MFQDPETSFKYRDYCSGLGEDSGEPAAGQGEKTEGRGLGGGTFVEFHVSGLNC